MIDCENPTLLTVNYIKPDKRNNIEECFEVVYKDDYGRIRLSHEPPLATIFFTKDKYRNHEYNKPQEDIKKLNKVQCKVSEIKYKIAEDIGEGGLSFINQCFQNKDFKSLNRLYGWRYSYCADFQPEYYFMKDWYDKYKMDTSKFTKAFIDIETDVLDHTPDLDNLQNTSYSPVNCVTVILSETMESFTFILRPYNVSNIGTSDIDYSERIKLYEKQLKDHNDLMNNMDAFIKDLNQSFDNNYGKIKYSIREYEREIDLITDVFRLLNDRKPNFCLAWNMRFDIQYLVERCKVLGYNPNSIMCHKDFKLQKCFFHVDRRVFQIEKQYDFFYCTSYTQYICQMRLKTYMTSIKLFNCWELLLGLNNRSDIAIYHVADSITAIGW